MAEAEQGETLDFAGGEARLETANPQVPGTASEDARALIQLDGCTGE